jgi:hypothetical protein
MASSDPKQGTFKVNDRRSFTEAGDERPTEVKSDGAARDGAPGAVQGESRDSARDRAPDGARAGEIDGRPGPAERAGAAGAADESGASDAASLPAVDFHTFILSLGSSALLHLGEIEHPEDGQVEKDLPLAKHTIDILSMLEAKTKGNLTAAEEKLMESLLYDLRLRYVNARK